MKNAGVIESGGCDRSYVGKGTVSAKQRGSAFRAKSAVNGMAACRKGGVFFVVSGYVQGGSWNKHACEIRRSDRFLAGSAMAVEAADGFG